MPRMSCAGARGAQVPRGSWRLPALKHQQPSSSSQEPYMPINSNLIPSQHRPRYFPCPPVRQQVSACFAAQKPLDNFPFPLICGFFPVADEPLMCDDMRAFQRLCILPSLTLTGNAWPPISASPGRSGRTRPLASVRGPRSRGHNAPGRWNSHKHGTLAPAAGQQRAISTSWCCQRMCFSYSQQVDVTQGTAGGTESGVCKVRARGR